MYTSYVQCTVYSIVDSFGHDRMQIYIFAHAQTHVHSFTHAFSGRSTHSTTQPSFHTHTRRTITHIISNKMHFNWSTMMRV